MPFARTPYADRASSRTTRSAPARLVRPVLLATALGAGTLLVTLAPASGAAPRASASATPRTSSGGTADVAFAGSLEYLDEKVVGPGFTKATGDAYLGRGAGSDALSQEILSGEISPNVFESIGSAPITALEPRFTHWYVQFAASPLVLAYNPKSRFAPELRAVAEGKRPIRDLFSVLSSPGFRLGRTDPNLDPQGAAFVEMVELAQSTFHLPPGTAHAVLGAGALGGSSSSEIFDETALEPRLEAGQLDASSAFLSQAIQLHLHYVPLPTSIDFGDPADAPHYATASLHLASGKVEHGKPLVVDATTITTPGELPGDTSAGAAFVAYVLSPAGRAELAKGGYRLLTPTLVGSRSAAPAAVLRELAG